MTTDEGWRPPTPEEARRWGVAETKRRAARETIDEERSILLPSHRFPDEYAPPDPEIPGGRGARSGAIRGLLGRSCSGWGRKPTNEEFHAAIRTRFPTPRQQAVANVLITEASINEIFLAYLQGAFTWRQLVRAMHRRDFCAPALVHWVNRKARCDR